MGKFNENVCEKIITQMKEKGVSRKDLSESLNITYNQACNILNRRCALTIDRLYEISYILDVPVNELII